MRNPLNVLGGNLGDFGEFCKGLGLAALVGGLAAKKLGLLALAGALLAKFGKLIAVGVIGAGALFKGLWRKKDKNQSEE